MPSRSAITAAGRIAAKSVTKSAEPEPSSRRSNNSAAICVMAPCSPATRRGVNARLTRARNWSWRGGSITIIIGRNEPMKSDPGGVGKMPSTEEYVP